MGVKEGGREWYEQAVNTDERKIERDRKREREYRQILSKIGRYCQRDEAEAEGCILSSDTGGGSQIHRQRCCELHGLGCRGEGAGKFVSHHSVISVLTHFPMCDVKYPHTWTPALWVL